jgi:hypothetical protein
MADYYPNLSIPKFGVVFYQELEDVEEDRYQNVNTTQMYLSVDIDTSVELDATSLDSTKKE